MSADLPRRRNPAMSPLPKPSPPSQGRLASPRGMLRRSRLIQGLLGMSLVVLLYIAASRSSYRVLLELRKSTCQETKPPTSGHLGPKIDSTENAQEGNPSWLPPYAERPYYDLVVAVLIVGGDSQEAVDEIARIRRVYERYGSQVVPDGGKAPPLTMRVVFVAGRAGLPENTAVPDTGLLLGDFFHVNVREGYAYLSDKTKAMMALSQHLRFRFLAKTDGDTFPCLSRVSQQLIQLPRDEQRRVYAGLLATCGKVFPPGHKLHDPEFLKATGGVLDCHPMYHQGAFYVLGDDIVQHLYRSRDLLTVMSVEDAMVGMWLLGIDKVILDIGGSFYCQCYTHPVPARKLAFYHFCKTDEKIDRCLDKFGIC